MSEFKTHTQLVNECLAELTSRTGNKIINPVTGSVIRSIIEAIFSILFFMQSIFKKLIRNIYIQYANGLFLDLKSKDFNIERKMPTYATTYLTVTRLRDDIEEVLQSGTICSTDPDITGQQKDYIVEENVRFPIGSLTEYVLVSSKQIGSIGNTSADTITLIKNVGMNISMVTNDNDVTNGVDIETDEELRNRLENHIIGLLGCNERSIRDAALSVEGVVYTFLLDDKNIPGISYLLVNNQNGDIDTSVLSEVRTAVRAVKPCGITINISRSPVKYVTIYAKIKVKNDFIDSYVANTVKTEIRKYINSIKPSQYLRIDNIISKIKSISGVDYIFNENDHLQVMINNDYDDIEDVNTYTMIRTEDSMITIDVE